MIKIAVFALLSVPFSVGVLLGNSGCACNVQQPCPSAPPSCPTPPLQEPCLCRAKVNSGGRTYRVSKSNDPFELDQKNDRQALLAIASKNIRRSPQKNQRVTPTIETNIIVLQQNDGNIKNEIVDVQESVTPSSTSVGQSSTREAAVVVNEETTTIPPLTTATTILTNETTTTTTTDDPASVVDGGRSEQSKCNSQVLKKLMLENINETSSNESKRSINAAAEHKFGGVIDVICSRGHFSYVYSSSLFCEATKNEMTCIAFRQAS